MGLCCSSDNENNYFEITDIEILNEKTYNQYKIIWTRHPSIINTIYLFYRIVVMNKTLKKEIYRDNSVGKPLVIIPYEILNVDNEYEIQVKLIDTLNNKNSLYHISSWKHKLD